MDKNTEITQKSMFNCCIPDCTNSKGSFFRFPPGKTSEWNNIIKTKFPDFVYDKNHRICARHFSLFNSSMSHQKLLKFSKSYNEDSVNSDRKGLGMSPGAEETAKRLQSPEHIIEISTTAGLPSPLRESLEEIIAEGNVVNESLPDSDLDEKRVPNEIKESPNERELDKSATNEGNSYEDSSDMKIRYPKCCVPKCTTSRRTNRNAHLFHFPKHKSSVWVDRIRAHHNEYIFKTYHRICAEHFSDINFTSTLYNRLCKFAVPDTFGGRVLFPNHRIKIIGSSKNILDSSQDISPTSHHQPMKTVPPNVNSDSGKIEMASPIPKSEETTDESCSVSSQNQVDLAASAFSSNKLNPYDFTRTDQEKVSQSNPVLSSKEKEFHPNEMKFVTSKSSKTDQGKVVLSKNADESSLSGTQPSLPVSPETDEPVAHNENVSSANGNRRNDDLLSHSPESHKKVQETLDQNSPASSPSVNELDQNDDSHPLITEPSKIQQRVLSKNNDILYSKNNGSHSPLQESQKTSQENCSQNNSISASKVNESSENESSHPLITQPSETNQLIACQNNQVLSSNVDESQLPDPGSSKADQETQNDSILYNIVMSAIQNSKKISKKRANENGTKTNTITCCIPNCGMSTFSNPDVHFFKFPQRKTMEWTRKIKSNFKGYSYKLDHKICQFHFSDSYFNGSTHNRLKNYALPSVFVNKMVQHITD